MSERETLQLIEERDNAEEAISQAYYIVTGRSPEWSNQFGYPEALEEIGDAVAALKAHIPIDAPPQPAPSPAGAVERDVVDELQHYADYGWNVASVSDLRKLLRRAVSELTRLRSAPAVTEEMVELAAKGMAACEATNWRSSPSLNLNDLRREMARAALAAALTDGGK